MAHGDLQFVRHLRTRYGPFRELTVHGGACIDGPSLVLTNQACEYNHYRYRVLRAVLKCTVMLDFISTSEILFHAQKIFACDSRLMKSQQQLMRYIRRRRFTNLQDRKYLFAPFLQFAVYTCRAWRFLCRLGILGI